MAKRKQKKIFRFISIILTVVTLISTNGSFLVWGMSGGDLGFTGVPKVQAKVARAITVEEIQKEAQQQKSHWWDFLWFGKNGREAKKGFSKFNMTYGEDTIKNGVDDRKSIFTDLKTELVAREVLGDKVVDVFNEEDGEPISKKIGWAEDVNQNGGSVTRYALKNNNDSREQVAINNKQQITNGKNNNLFQNATTQLVEEGENVKSKDQFQQNDIDDISKYIEVIEINAPKKHFWNKWWEWFRQIFSSDAKTSILGNSSNNKIKKVNKPNAYNPNSGKPLIVAVIDSGYDSDYSLGKVKIDRQVDFTSRVLKSDNSSMIDGGRLVYGNEINDVNGHGTDVFNSMVNGDPEFRKMVSNGKIKLVVFKVSNKSNIDVDNIINAINTAKKNGVNIINISSVSYYLSNKKQQALHDFVDTGGTIITAAGNEGDYENIFGHLILDPSYSFESSNIIKVGSMDNKNKLVKDYTTGRMVKGGVDIYAQDEMLLDGSAIAGKNSSTKRVVQGTSFASPVVTGLIAARIVRGEIPDVDGDGKVGSNDVKRYVVESPSIDTPQVISVQTARYKNAILQGYEYDPEKNKFFNKDGSPVWSGRVGVDDLPSQIEKKIEEAKNSGIAREREELYKGISIVSRISEPYSEEEMDIRRSFFNSAYEIMQEGGFKFRRISTCNECPLENFFVKEIDNDKAILIKPGELEGMSYSEIDKLIRVVNNNGKKGVFNVIKNIFYGDIDSLDLPIASIEDLNKYSKEKNTSSTVLKANMKYQYNESSNKYRECWVGDYFCKSGEEIAKTDQSVRIINPKINTVTYLDELTQSIALGEFVQKESEYYIQEKKNDKSNHSQQAANLRSAEKEYALNQNSQNSNFGENNVGQKIGGSEVQKEEKSSWYKPWTWNVSSIFGGSKNDENLASAGKDLNGNPTYGVLKSDQAGDNTDNPNAPPEYLMRREGDDKNRNNYDNTKELEKLGIFESSKVQPVEKGWFSGIGDTVSGWFGGGDSKLNDRATKAKAVMLTEITSPEYFERLVVEFDGDKEKAQQWLQKRIDRVQNTEIKIVGSNHKILRQSTINGITSAWLSAYGDEGQDVIYINRDRVADSEIGTVNEVDANGNPKYVMEDILYHEIGHVSRANGLAMPQKTYNLLSNSTKTQEDWKRVASDREKVTGWFYYTKQEEMATRVRFLREDLKKHLGKTPGDKITATDIENLKRITATNDGSELNQQTIELLNAVDGFQKAAQLVNEIADTKQYGFGDENQLYADLGYNDLLDTGHTRQDLLTLDRQRKEQASLSTQEEKDRKWYKPLTWGADTKKDHTPITPEEYAKQQSQTQQQTDGFRMYPEFEDNNYTGYDNKGDAGSEDVAKDVLFTVSNNQESSKLQEKLTVDNSSLKEYVSKLSNEDWYKLANQDESGFFGGLFENKEEKRARRIAKSAALKAETTIRENIQRAKGAGWSTDGINTPNERAYYFENYLRSNLRDVKDFSRDFKPNIQQKLEDLRSKKLQRMQTSKYLDELTVEFGGDKQKAEEELELRLARVKAMSIVPLTAEEMKNKTLRSGIGGTVDDNSKTLYLNVDNYNENKLLNALWHESRHMSAAGNANVTESTKKLFQESKKSFEEWKQEDQHFFKLEDNVNDKILRERYCYLTGSCGGFKDEPRARESQVEMDIERHCGGSGQSATQSQVDCLLHIYKTEPQKLKQDTQEFLEVIKPEKVLNVLHSVADTEQYGLGKNNGELVADTQRTFPAYDPKIDGPIYDEQGSKISVNSKKGLLSRAISWIPFIGGPKEATADPEGLITDGLVIRKATGPNAGEIVGYTEKGKNVNADIDTMMTSGDQEDLFGFGGNSSAQIQQDATDKQDFSWVKPWTWFNKKNNAKTTAEIDALDSFYTAGDTNGDGEDQVALNQQQTDGFRMYPEFEGVALKDISDEEWQKAAMESVNRASGSDILLGDNNMSGRNMDLFLEGAEMSSGVRDGAVLRGQGAKSQTQIDLERELKQLNEGGIRVDSNGVNTEARKEQIRNELYKINSGQVVQNTTDTNSGQVALNQKQVADDLENLMNDEELFGFVDDALLSSLPICPVFSQATTKMNSTKPQTGPCRGGASVFTNPINNGVKHLEEQVKGIPVVGGVVSIFGSGIKLLTSAVDKTAGFADKIIEGNYTAQDVINTVDTGLVALSLFTDSGISGTFVVGVVPDSVKDLTAGLFLPKDNKDSITWDQFTAQAPAEFKEGRNIKKPEDVVNYIAAAAYDAGVGIALDKLGISNLVVKESVKQVLLKNGVEIGRAFQSGDDKKIEKALIKLSEDTESKAKNIASGVVAGELYEAFGLNSENKVVQLIATRLQVKEQIKKATGDIFSGDKDVETALSEMVDNMDKNAAREVNRAIKELENAPETVQKALKKRLELAVENKEKELTGLIKDAVKINGNSAIVKYVNKTTSKTLDQAIEDASGFFFDDKTVKVDLNLDGVLEEITTEQAKQLRDKLNGKMGFIGLNIKKTEVGDIVLVSKTGENELARVNSEGKIISQEDRLSEELDKMMSENQDIFGLDSGEEQNSKKEDQDSTSKKASDSSKSASIGDSINNYIDETLDGLSIVPMEVEESKRLLETFSALPEEEQAKRKYLLNKPLSEMTGNEQLEYAHLTGQIPDETYETLKKESEKSESSVVGQEVVSVIGADNSKKQNSTIGQKTSQPESPSWFSKWWNSWSLPSLSSLFDNNDNKTEQSAAVGEGNTDDTKSKTPQRMGDVTLPEGMLGASDKNTNDTIESAGDDSGVLNNSSATNNTTVSNPKYYWEDDFGEKYNLVSDKQYKKDGDSFVECSDDDLTYSTCNYPNNLNGVIRVDGNAGNDRIVVIEDPVVDSIDVNTQGARPPTENDFGLGEFLSGGVLAGAAIGGKEIQDKLNESIAKGQEFDTDNAIKLMASNIIEASTVKLAEQAFGAENDKGESRLGLFGNSVAEGAAGVLSAWAIGDTDRLVETAAGAVISSGWSYLEENKIIGADNNEDSIISDDAVKVLQGDIGKSIVAGAADAFNGDWEKGVRVIGNGVARHYIKEIAPKYISDSLSESIDKGLGDFAGDVGTTALLSTASQLLLEGKLDGKQLAADVTGVALNKGVEMVVEHLMEDVIQEAATEAIADALTNNLNREAANIAGEKAGEAALGDMMGNIAPFVGVAIAVVKGLITEGKVDVKAVAIAAASAASGMAAGAALGSVIPGIGTVVGAVVGVVLGMLTSGAPKEYEIADWKAITREAVNASLDISSISGNTSAQIAAVAASGDTARAKGMMREALSNTALGKTANMVGLGGLFESALALMNNRIERLNGSYVNKRGDLSTEDHINTGDAELDRLTNEFIERKGQLKHCYTIEDQECVSEQAQEIRKVRNRLLTVSVNKFNERIAKLNQQIHSLEVAISQTNNAIERARMEERKAKLISQRNTARSARDQSADIIAYCPRGTYWHHVDHYCKDNDGTAGSRNPLGINTREHCIHRLGRWKWDGHNCVERGKSPAEKCEEKGGTWRLDNDDCWFGGGNYR